MASFTANISLNSRSVDEAAATGTFANNVVDVKGGVSCVMTSGEYVNKLSAQDIKLETLRSGDTLHCTFD
jgi:hypothetical protein